MRNYVTNHKFILNQHVVLKCEFIIYLWRKYYEITVDFKSGTRHIMAVAEILFR